LGAGDRIQMDIFNVPEYSGPNGQHQVQADGSLSLPLIGSVSVYGMTLEQAANSVKERYGKYLKRPWITLKLLAARPLQIAIAGEINRPGAYTISSAAGPGGTTEQMGTQMPTISRALRMAGGITQSADVRQIKIRRPQRNAQEQIINVDLWELLQAGDLRADLTLRDGDTIFIPTVTSLNRQEAPTLAVANITGQSTQPINIAVVGEVARPGTYTLAKDVQSKVQENELGANSGLFGASETAGGETVLQQTVTRAIKMAGGITPIADIRQIQVRRLTRAGTEQIINVDLWQLLQTGDVSQDLTLQQGDTVIVPKAENIDETQGAQVANSNFSPDTIKVSISFLSRYEHRRIHFLLLSGGSTHHQSRNLGDLCRHRIHNHRAGIGRLTARDVNSRSIDRRIPLAQNCFVRAKLYPRLREALSMKRLYLFASQPDCI
jgi:Periplasmic protein involved in polysaccharide export